MNQPQFVNYKPSIACLLLHQVVWDYKEGYDKEVYYCPRCDYYFCYPSEKDKNPVYSK